MEFPETTQIRFDESKVSVLGTLMHGKHFGLDLPRFEDHLMSSLGSLTADLMRIAAGVYVADRLKRRRTGSPWSASVRDMRLSIQVLQPAFWTDPYVRSLIEDLLRFLSSDLWSLEFTKLPLDPMPRQGALGLDEEAAFVCLYSGGLDSAAGLATWLRDHSDPVLAVSVLHQSHLKPLCGNHLRLLRNYYERNVNLVPVRVHLIGPGRLDAQERTQRCRSFLFLAAGVVTAIARGVSKVLVFESGVGVVNAPMMAGMATGARTTRSSHPYLLKRMSELATLIARRPIDIELPYWRRTKAELVANLAGGSTSDDLQRLARSTVSCVHHPRHALRRQCGVCPACIGRRQAMLCAGIDEDPHEYEHDIFAADDAAAPPPETLEFLKAVIGQVHDFGAISPELKTPDLLERWIFGTRVADSEAAARPWLDALSRYRNEWLRLAEIHRDGAVPWARWLLSSRLSNAYETERHVSGF